MRLFFTIITILLILILGLPSLIDLEVFLKNTHVVKIRFFYPNKTKIPSNSQTSLLEMTELYAFS